MAGQEVSSVSSGYTLSLFKTLRSEWIKLVTLRSTWWLTLVAVLANVGICLIMSASLRLAAINRSADAGSPSNGPEGEVGPGELGMLSEYITQGCNSIGPLIFIILAILVITNEYSSGMIRSTFTVGPRRSRVLIAKLVVIAIMGVLIFGISLAIGWSGGYLILQDTTGFDLTLTSATSLRILSGFVAEMVLLAWLCFGLGAWIRSTAGSIGAAIGVIWILPMIFMLVTSIYTASGNQTGWRKWLIDSQQFLPTNAGGRVTELSMPDSALFGPWEGLGILGGWALLALVIGFIATVRRDA